MSCVRRIFNNKTSGFFSGLYLQVSLSLFSRYVQGGLNPGKNPVYTGNVSMSSFVPNGTYQVRYLVNSKFISIMEMGTLKARSDKRLFPISFSWTHLFKKISLLLT